MTIPKPLMLERGKEGLYAAMRPLWFSVTKDNHGDIVLLGNALARDTVHGWWYPNRRIMIGGVRICFQNWLWYCFNLMSGRRYRTSGFKLFDAVKTFAANAFTRMVRPYLSPEESHRIRDYLHSSIEELKK